MIDSPHSVWLVLGSLMFLHSVKSATIEGNSPIDSPDSYTLVTSYTNPSEGTYDNARTTIFSIIMDSSFRDEFSLSVVDTQEYDSLSGWMVSPSRFRDTIYHDEVNYTLWDSGTISLALTINKSTLERNGSPGHQPFTLEDVENLNEQNFEDFSASYDTIVARNDDPILLHPNYIGPNRNKVGRFTAFAEDGSSPWSAESVAYSLVYHEHFYWTAPVETKTPLSGPEAVSTIIVAHNVNQGFEWQSLTYEHYQTLGQDLYELRPNEYASLEGFLEVAFRYRGLDGSAEHGWTSSIQEDGTISATHIDGYPDYDYQTFDYGRYQVLRLNLRTSFLDLTTGTDEAYDGWQPFTAEDVSSRDWNPDDYDAIVVRSDNSILDLPNYIGDDKSRKAAVIYHLSTFTTKEYSSNAYVVVSPNDFVRVPIISEISVNDNGISIDLSNLDTARSYRVLFSLNLVDWSEIDAFTPANGSKTWNGSTSPDRGFYILSVE